MPGPRRATSTLTAATLLALLAACSSAAPQGGATGPSSSAGGATPSGTVQPSSSAATTSTTTTAAAPARTITITVKGKKVTPAPSRVEVRSRDTLRLVVTVDHDDELHAHGFDVERELTAGQPTTIDLTGAPPGLYEVETHHPALRLLQVVVRP